MTKLSVKVEIADNKPDELIDLGDDVLKKHLELGATSPLLGLDMETFERNLNEAKENRAEAKRLHRMAEAMNQKAGFKLGIDKSQNTRSPGTVYSIITSARDILLGLNKSQEKKLSEWGFSVIISDVAKNNKVNPN